MSRATSIVHWESTIDASRRGIEIVGPVLGERRLEAELDRSLGGRTVIHPSFVLASGGSGQLREVAAAIAQASNFFFQARVCLAIDKDTLHAMDPATLRDKDFGIVLDQVNANTPLSAISADLVEAVRFERDFIQRAATDLRLSCVVDAMLKLAHDLGLATLGSAPHVGGGQDNVFKFDYVSAPRAKN